MFDNRWLREVDRVGAWRMKRRISSVLVLVLILRFSIGSFSIVRADPVTVDTSTEYYAVGIGFSRTGFYAEGLFWAFYSDGAWGGWEFSADGITWTGEFTSIGACPHGLYFSVWFDGIYVHYARSDAASSDLKYRRGEPQNDGTISWSAVEQTVHNGDPQDKHDVPCITVDSGGYAWIGTKYYVDPNSRPYAIKNANNDGTWATDFSTQLNAASGSWRVCPVPLTEGKVYVVYCEDYERPLGRLYDAGWGGEENDLADDEIYKGFSFSAVADGDDVHFIYKGEFPSIISYNKRTFGAGWGATDVTVHSTVQTYCAPALSIDTATSDLYCFWTRTSPDHVYYKKYSAGSWDADPTDWIDESTDEILWEYLMSSYYQDYDRYIGVLYVTKKASPYNVRFGFLTLESVNDNPVNDALDSDATFNLDAYGWSNVTVSDADLVADLKTVDIQVNTTGDAETFTLRWNQSANSFSELSDASGICTLDASTSVRVNIDADTDKIAFYFKFTGGTMGSCDVKVTSTDDADATDTDTYSSEFDFGSAPVNDAINSEIKFDLDIYGWSNVTVTEMDGVAQLKTVDIQVNTTGDAENFTLRWTQATNTFSEVSDASEICTIDVSTSIRVNIDADTDKIAFYFKFTGGTMGSCDVKVTSTDDADATDIDTYSSEFDFSDDPINDALDSDATFNFHLYGWSNVTVSDPNGVADLKTVDIQVNTTGDAENFTLRWTQATNTFSEVNDASGICTLDASTSVRVNIDSDTDKIAFYFKFTGGTEGSCDVKVTSTDDSDDTDIDTYSSEFGLDTLPPINDALDSDNPFYFHLYGWSNVTVTDTDLVADLKTVDIQVNTTGDAENFTLRWTQATNTFSEMSDASGICTLDASTSTRVNIDADTDKIAFYFKFTGGTEGSCDVKVTSTDDSDDTDIDTYSSEFNLSKLATITITNIGADGWVFEGKTRYQFNIIYTYVDLTSINQVGLGFTDETAQFHSVSYNKEADTLTVSSPEDSISGWIDSLTQTGPNVTAVYQIMFNKPIPDTYNVTVEVRRITDFDSGWIVIGENVFSIYNLGGLTSFTSSGMAGRILGGDLFEIYAADTRTRNIVPLEDFDVRVSPLTPGVQIAGVQIIPAGDEQALLDEIDNAIIFMTTRLENHTMYPTNRIIDGMSATAKTYVSWPFGLRIHDEPRSLSRIMFLEKEFFRKISASDAEIVTVQVFAMVPTTSGTTGRIAVSENGYYPYHAYEGANPDRAANLIFAGNGSIRAADGATFTTIGSYTGETWYNFTFVLNPTPRTYDVYIDGNLNASGLGFQDGANVDSLGYVSFLQNLWAPIGNHTDMFIDDVWVHTNFTTAYGGQAKATILFNWLQHWSMDFDFFVENGQVYAQGESGSPERIDDDYSNFGYVELGWDVMINETWVTDFLVARVNISDGYISGKNNWIQFNVTWYNQGDFVKNDLLYGLFEGYSIFPGGEKDTAGFHWDIWFNRVNASTVVGGRVNTEYFGLSDKAVWWAVWSSRWIPMRSEVSESTMFVDLKDSGGTIHSAKEVSLVRSWVKVLRNAESQFAYKILNIGGLDFLSAIDTMSGINTPPIRETQVPAVWSGFLGSALGGYFTAAIKRLSNALSGFGLTFFSLSIEFMDNVFSALGYPALASTILGWMSTLFSNVPTLIGFGLTFIKNIFSLVNTSATDILTQLTNIITIWVGMYGTLKNLLDGVLTPGINLWNDLGINSFIKIGAVLYPIWLLILWSDKGTQSLIDHLTGLLSIGSFFLNFILSVAEFFIGLLQTIIGAIRG